MANLEKRINFKKCYKNEIRVEESDQLVIYEARIEGAQLWFSNLCPPEERHKNFDIEGKPSLIKYSLKETKTFPKIESILPLKIASKTKLKKRKCWEISNYSLFEDEPGYSSKNLRKLIISRTSLFDELSAAGFFDKKDLSKTHSLKGYKYDLIQYAVRKRKICLAPALIFSIFHPIEQELMEEYIKIKKIFDNEIPPYF